MEELVKQFSEKYNLSKDEVDGIIERLQTLNPDHQEMIQDAFQALNNVNTEQFERALNDSEETITMDEIYMAAMTKYVLTNREKIKSDPNFPTKLLERTINDSINMYNSYGLLNRTTFTQYILQITQSYPDTLDPLKCIMNNRIIMEKWEQLDLQASDFNSIENKEVRDYIYSVIYDPERSKFKELQTTFSNDTVDIPENVKPPVLAFDNMGFFAYGSNIDNLLDIADVIDEI